MCLFIASNVLSVSQVYGLATRWKEILFFLMAFNYLYTKQLMIKNNEYKKVVIHLSLPDFIGLQP